MPIDLLRVLEQAGVQRLYDGRQEISGLCPNPQHNDTKPSWSINKTTYLHHCFSCGYSGTLQGLLTELTGSAPPDLETTLKSEGFLQQMAKARLDPVETLADTVPLLTEWSLANLLSHVPEKLLALRKLIRSAIDFFQVRYDREAREWVLPIRSPAGQLWGAQYRRVGSVMTRPTGIQKSMTLFGLSAIQRYEEAVLVESPLDAVRLFGIGIPAVASLGAFVSDDQVQLLARNFGTVYMALDNDKAGRQGASFATQALRRRGAAVIPWRYEGMTDEDGRKAKDPGDAADDEMLWAAWERTRRMGL
jgi:DNA primase